MSHEGIAASLSLSCTVKASSKSYCPIVCPCLRVSDPAGSKLAPAADVSPSVTRFGEWIRSYPPPPGATGADPYLVSSRGGREGERDKLSDGAITWLPLSLRGKLVLPTSLVILGLSQIID